MEKWLILGILVFPLAHKTEATSHCPVDVAFIIDSSGSISDAEFQVEKDFVKQAAGTIIDLAPGQSRAAIILFGESASVEVTLGQHPTKEQFQSAVDNLVKKSQELGHGTRIEEALKVATNDVFSSSRTSARRVVMLLSDGIQAMGSAINQEVERASENLRKFGVRVLAVATGDVTDTTILGLVTERSEDVVMSDKFNDLLSKLPRMTACGSCVCTTGDSYITIDNFQSQKYRNVDDIRFEFKSETDGSGVVMSLQGSNADHVYVGYENDRLHYNVNLGTGEGNFNFGPLENKWLKAHAYRAERLCTLKVKSLERSSSLWGSQMGETPGSNIHLDVPSSKAYFLGSPESVDLPNNFVGCIRYFTVEGKDPIVKAWAENPDSSIEMQKGSMRPCTASDEMYD